MVREGEAAAILVPLEERRVDDPGKDPFALGDELELLDEAGSQRTEHAADDVIGVSHEEDGVAGRGA